MINVKEEDDGTFSVSWDQNDPKEMFLNNWTEEDFIKSITDFLENETDGESKDL
jgi:hypothetical protein